MSTVMSNKKTKKKPVDQAQQELFPEKPVEPKKAQQVALVDYLKVHCMEVHLEVNWYSTSKTLDSATAKAMLSDYNASVDSVGMSKRLFGSGHPLVKAANKAKTALLAYRDSMTTAVAKVPPLNMSEEDAAKFLQKEPGTRLIETTSIEDFDQQVQILVGNLKASVKALNDGLDSVKEFDKKRLGTLFKDSDYPNEVTAEVRGPYYKEVNYSADFESVAPNACKRMKDALFHRLAGGVDATIGDFARSLVDLAKQIANQLGNRTRLLVPKGHALSHLREAEVIEYLTPDNDPEVPAGKIMVNVRYTPNGKKKNETEWLELTPEEYQALKPYETNERKKLYESSLDNLKQQCVSVKNVAAMLGEQGTPIVTAASKLEDLLASVGTNNKEVLEELRSSEFVRKQTTKALSELTSALTSQFSVKEVFTERRRSIGKFKKRNTSEDEE